MKHLYCVLVMAVTCCCVASQQGSGAPQNETLADAALSFNVLGAIKAAETAFEQLGEPGVPVFGSPKVAGKTVVSRPDKNGAWVEHWTIQRRGYGVIYLVVFHPGPDGKTVGGVARWAIAPTNGEGSTDRAVIDAARIPREEWEPDFVVAGLSLNPSRAAAPKPADEPVRNHCVIFERGEIPESPSVRPLRKVAAAPVFPPELRDAEVFGDAVVAFEVTRRGRTRNIQVVSASHRLFAASARKALTDWVWEPARTAAGQPVDSIVVQRVRFEKAHHPLTDALVDLVRRSGAPDAEQRAAAIRLKLLDLLTNAASTKIDLRDGIDETEAFKLATEYLARMGQGVVWDVAIPLHDGERWKVRFAQLPTPGPIGSLLVVKKTGEIEAAEINGRPIR
jgi:hypothetical protein